VLDAPEPDDPGLQRGPASSGAHGADQGSTSSPEPAGAGPGGPPRPQR
jgi:hypothetical protein